MEQRRFASHDLILFYVPANRKHLKSYSQVFLTTCLQTTLIIGRNHNAGQLLELIGRRSYRCDTGLVRSLVRSAVVTGTLRWD